ncbi:MAG: hypothetical protein PF501_13845 [Salinisphaera sp.]|jgi:hypothetical protein|nr:hypothetical protein [Salinisphaera sp.]
MLKLLETIKDSAESTFDSAASRVENVHGLVGRYVTGRTRRLRGRAEPRYDKDSPDSQPVDLNIYDVIRGVNRELGEFGTDVFEIIDDARARRRAERHQSRDE